MTYREPWTVAFSFGLLHGLGFATALGQIGLAEHAIPLALAIFYVGVKIGQLLFVFAFFLPTWPMRRLPITPRPAWNKVLPYIIGSLASFWVNERMLGFWG